MLRLGWREAVELMKRIADSTRGRVDAVLAVARGGLIPGFVIAVMLGLNRVYYVRIKRYSDGKPPKLLYDKPLVVSSNVGRLDGLRVLVVDDVARTGATLGEAELYARQRGAVETYTAALVVRGNVRIDYCGARLDECVEFPWEELSHLLNV